MKKFIWISSLVLVFGLALYIFICGRTFSEGTRSGVLYKLSYTGYIFKTYEGELNLGGFDESGTGTIMQQKIWDFSISDRQMFDRLNQYQGKKIAVDYKEVIRVFPWQGHTRYFITNVHELEH